MSASKQDDKPAYTEDGIRIYYNYGETPMDVDGWCYINGKMQPLKIVNVMGDAAPVKIEPTQKIKTRKRCV